MSPIQAQMLVAHELKTPTFQYASAIHKEKPFFLGKEYFVFRQCRYVCVAGEGAGRGSGAGVTLLGSEF